MSVSLPACPSVFFSCLGVSYARLTFALKSSFCWSVHLSHCSWTCVCVCVCGLFNLPFFLSWAVRQLRLTWIKNRFCILFFVFSFSVLVYHGQSVWLPVSLPLTVSVCVLFTLSPPPPHTSQLSRISHIRETTWLC